MRRLLQAGGHQVEVAADVAMALKLATAKPFDLLLSFMTHRWQWIRPDAGFATLGLDLPRIALSSYSQTQDVHEIREAGIAAHLIKPVSLPKLEGAMATVTRALRATGNN